MPDRVECALQRTTHWLARPVVVLVVLLLLMLLLLLVRLLVRLLRWESGRLVAAPRSLAPTGDGPRQG